MNEWLWFAIKTYAVVGLVYVLWTVWYDYNREGTPEETAQDEATWEEMSAWPWYVLWGEMAMMYAIAWIFWPRFLYLTLTEELQ